MTTTDPLRPALTEAYEAMDAALQWAAGETGGIKTLTDVDRHIAGYDALLDATVKAGQALGVLSGGFALAAEAQPGLDAEMLGRAFSNAEATSRARRHSGSPLWATVAAEYARLTARAALAADTARPVGRNVQDVQDARPGLRIAVCPHCGEELSVAADTRPRLDAETLACAMEQFYGKAEGTMLDSAAAIAAEYIRLTEDRP